MTQRRALIIGLGLIGGSIGLALRRRGWHVAYDDPFVSLGDATARGAADGMRAGSADVIIVATPVDTAIDILAAELPADAPVVTTVCSVLAPLANAAASDRSRFVAGHPMAGSQERGLGAARADLFDGARWFVDRRDELVSDVIADCGAIEELVDADEHDQAMAVVSHLPQILSTALAAHLDESTLRFAGPGLQTFLRLAGSEAAVWRPIVDANRDAIAPHAAAVASLVQQILDGDDEAFARARRLYIQLSSGRP
jgi:prephenate dehydrogenase